MRMPLKSALFVVGLASLAGAASAQPREYKPQAPQVAPALDRVAMTAFVCEPSPIPPGTTQVTLRVTIKNVTGGLQGVTLSGLKIRILRTNPQPDVLELETTVNNLAPGASQTVGARVNVGPGVRDYFARVDPDDILHEPIVQRANNESRLKLTIPQVSRDQAPPPGTTPQKETQLLDYDKAKRSGAQFSAGVEGATPCTPVGAFDQKQYPDYSLNRPAFATLFVADCHPGGLPSPFGARATPEAFTGFRLKNGWKVKSFDVVAQNVNGGNWEWRKTPSNGTDDPSMRMHVWADGGGWVLALVKVEIEGPSGTNPYQ